MKKIYEINIFNSIKYRMNKFLINIYFPVYLLNKIFAPDDKGAKVGASINIFDGEELLLDLVLNIKPHVDRLSVVYQQKGHWGGLEAHARLSDFLTDLQSKGYLDKIIEFSPPKVASDIDVFNSMDLQKRELGLEDARNSGMDYFINLDNDEFYSADQFRYMKKFMVNFQHKYNVSVVKHIQYYKNNSFVKRRREEEYVLGLVKIEPNSRFVYNLDYPFPIDPGRKVSNFRIKEFARFEIQMHHFSYVRNTLEKKLKATHAREGNAKDFDVIVGRHLNYKFPENALWAHATEEELKKITPRIKLSHFEDNFFEKWAAGEVEVPPYSPDSYS